MKVLEISAYDAILGYDWLQMNSPMQCNWADKTLQFQNNGNLVTLQGVQPAGSAVQEVSVQQVRKWNTGNDIWAVVVVEAVPDSPRAGHSEAIQQLLKTISGCISGTTTFTTT